MGRALDVSSPIGDRQMLLVHMNSTFMQLLRRKGRGASLMAESALADKVDMRWNESALTITQNLC